MIKTNIKMRVTPEQSKRVQEICFENGILWGDKSDKVFLPDCGNVCLLIRDCITFHSIDYNNSYPDEEIDADLFIKTNGTCEKDLIDKISNELEKENIKPYQCRCVMTPIIDKETYLTKYTSQPKDLESALKKIENLHTALNKKRDKNKNQALEITNLLKQNKDLKGTNDTQNEYIRQLEIDIKQARNEVNFMIDVHKIRSETIKETYDFKLEQKETYDFKLEQKDTIISYLESKLK